MFYCKFYGFGKFYGFYGAGAHWQSANLSGFTVDFTLDFLGRSETASLPSKIVLDSQSIAHIHIAAILDADCRIINFFCSETLA